VPSDAQESKGDAAHQLPTRNRARADTPRSLGCHHETIKAAVDIAKQRFTINFGGGGLNRKKPSARRKSVRILRAKFAQMGAYLSAQPIANHRGSDFAGHRERDARRLLADH